MNNYFHNIYLLNLKRRKDKLEKIINKLYFNYEIFEGIDGMYNNNNYILSCTLSHINILKNAIKNNYKNYLVLEDDILIHKNIDIFPFESLHK